jgi:dTDP-glucose 4,6-dehydratase
MVTNCSNNYGPYQFPEKLIPVIIKSLVKNNKIPIYGDGQQIREWLFVEDHCDAILKVINKGVIGESYNIGSKNEIANIELVEKIIKAYNDITGSNKDLNSCVKYVKDRLGHDFRYSVNCKKLQSQLGWKNETSFMESLTQTVNWYLDNPKWLNL